MAYASGTVNSFADLVTAIRNACTSNGWTLSGNVLRKSTCYTQLTAVTGGIQVLGGTGIDGSNALIGAPDYPQRMTALGIAAVSFPASYEIFIGTAPDEVYMVLNHDVNFYPWLAFGQSPAPGITASGNWQAGNNAPYGIAISSSSAYAGAMGWVIATSGTTSNSSDQATYRVQHGLDGNTWSDNGTGVGDNSQDVWADRASLAICVSPITEMLDAQPNTWNSEAVLLPLEGWINRADSKVTKVSIHAHARAMRIDNYAPGAILTLGTDRWKVYPWVRKNAANRNGQNNSDSGTFGWALRYDGP